MQPLSTLATKSTTKKFPKYSRSPAQIASKVVAFCELTSLNDTKMSSRKASALLEVPNSTMQYWTKNDDSQAVKNSIVDFFESPDGILFLNRILHAAFVAIHYGRGGVRSLREFLCLSQLNQFVASSEGALQSFVVRCENHIVKFSAEEEKRLVQQLKHRKITIGLDEMFRGHRPCLVAMEIVSGYLLLEKFTKDRTTETWLAELKPRLDDLNVNADQIVSDMGTSIRAAARDLEATHIPELFHAQLEISKGTSAPLASQEGACAKNVKVAEKEELKMILKYGGESEEAKQAQGKKKLLQFAHRKAIDRQNRVRVAKKELGKIHHPINLSTGKPQNADDVKVKFDMQLTEIERCISEAEISADKRLKKARRAFDSILEYFNFFCVWYTIYVQGLHLSEKQEQFFNEVVFPLCYLQKIWRQVSREQREQLKPLKERLDVELRTLDHTEEQIRFWMDKGRECAEKFQRSTSCLEGRNGGLSFYHHRFCRINDRSGKALTAMQNYHSRRSSDQSTAAMRFFGMEHANLFESLVKEVRIPGKPRKQNHDSVKRSAGWEKRRMKKEAA